MERENIPSKKVQLSKIVVPLLIVLIVVGIWVVKNTQRGSGIISDQGDGENEALLHEDYALNISQDFDFEELKEHELPIVLDFGSETCPPCRQMAPILEKVHKDVLGKAIIKYIDVDKFKQIASDYPVKVIPTQFFFDKDGKPYMPADLESSSMLIYTVKDTKEHVLTAHEGGLTEEQLLGILKEMGMENDR